MIFLSKAHQKLCAKSVGRAVVSTCITRHIGEVFNNTFLLVPKDYDELLSYYTHKGYRVIGCATRHLNRLSWVRAQKMTRTEVERDLDFIGFIIFENKLKPSTAGVLRELKESNIGTVMVTGDNILTAISVARECGLLDRHAHCFVPRFVNG